MTLSNPFGDSSNDSDNNERTEGEDYIEWNGEEIEDFITVTDRDGEEHHYPKIEERSAEGELYRFALMVNYLWGGEIGRDDEITSTRLPTDHRNFPNQWIGQTEDNPDGSLETAKSPRAFLFREFGAKNGFRDNDGPLPEIRNKFHDKCDYSIEAYKANFPEATGWSDDMEMTKVDEHPVKHWEDRWIPAELAEQFDGMPPLRQTVEEPEEETKDEPEEDSEEEAAGGDFNITKVESIIEESDTDKDAVKNLLDYDDRLYEMRDWVQDAVGCSKTTFYTGRNEWDEENSETEDDPEPETEQETDNEPEEEADDDQNTGDLEKRVEELEEEVEQLKKAQYHTAKGLEILTEMDE